MREEFLGENVFALQLGARFMNRYLGWVIGLLVGVGVTGMASLKAGGADAGDLLRQAKEALALQNYNEALQKSQQVLESKPAQDVADEAKNVQGHANASLGNLAQAYEILKDLVTRRPEYARKKDTVRQLAIAARESAGPEEFIKYSELAIGLFQASGETKLENEHLFMLAMYYRNQQHLRDQDRSDWQVNQVDGAIRAIHTLDRVLASKASMEDQIAACQQKSEIMVQSHGSFQNVPKEKWPAGVEFPYDATKPLDLAIRFQEEIGKRFPEHPSAANAMIQIAQIQSNNKQDFVAAVKTCNEVIARFGRLKDPVRDANYLIRQITSPTLSIQTMGIVRPGENVKFQWSGRNIQAIDFEAHRLDLVDFLRNDRSSLDLVSSVQQLKPQGEGVLKWSLDTGDDGTHQYLSSGEKPFESVLRESGAYLIRAKGRGTKVEVNAIAIVSKLAMVMKTGKTKADFFVVDVDTGKPIPQTELLVRRFVRNVQVPILNTSRPEFEYKSLTVPDSGLAEVPLTENLKSEDRYQHQLVAVARVGNDYAATFSHSWFGWWGWQNGEYGYVYTDRPVYRPNQVVHFRAMLRHYEAGEFKVQSDRKVNVVITDSKGEKLYEKQHLTSDQGTLSGSFTLDEEPALGSYGITVGYADGHGINLNNGTQFRVEEYKKPEFEVTVEADKPLHKLGDKMKVKVHGDYYFGGPVVEAKVSYTVHRESIPAYFPWIRPFDWFYTEESRGGMGYWPGRPHRQDLVLQGELATDAEGNAFVDVPTEAFPGDPDQDVQYKFDVTMVDSSRREIRASQTIKVTKRAFSIQAEPKKHIYQPGDTVKLDVKASNANNQPVSFEGTKMISLVTQRETRKESGEIDKKEELKQLENGKVQIGERGEGEISFVADKEGLFKIVIESPDPFTAGEKIIGSTYVWVAKAGGAYAHYASRDIEIVLEKETYRAGETAKLLINCRQPKSYVLLTADGDDIYKSQIVYVDGTQAVVDWPIDLSFRPTVQIHATTISQNKIFEETAMMRVPPVEQFLTVKIISPKAEYRPREEATVDVVVVDHEGNPAGDVELSLGVFDASILYIQPETRGDIRKYFHGQQRPVTVQTTSSFFFWPNQGYGAMHQWYMTRDGRGFGGGGLGGAMMLGRMEQDGMPMPASAPMAKGMVANEAAADEAKDPFAATETRSDFRDTVYWGAHLKTDSAGKASATIKFPDSLTSWRLTAIGADVKTRVGEVVHEVRTKKNILVRLEMPRFVVEGDKLVVSAIVHNYFADARKVKVDLGEHEGLKLLGSGSSEWAMAREGTPLATADIEVAAGGEKRVDFVFAATRVGNVSVTAKALSSEESDAMKLEIPCFEYGAEKLLAESGIIFGNSSTRQATARLMIPEAIRSDSQSLTIRVSPTAAGVMLESLPYLIQYPYGCVEQTMSRFLPSVLTARTLEELGMKPSDLAKLPTDKVVADRLKKWHDHPVFNDGELQRVIRSGVARLGDFQHADGGWGWWKQDESNPYMTAYVVSGLELAREAKVVLPAGMLERGVEFLATRAGAMEAVSQYPWMRNEDVSLRAYMLYAIGQANPERLRSPELIEQLRKIFAKRDGLTDYARALVAIALADANLREESQIVLSNIKDRVVLSKETNTASWGKSSGYYYWYDVGTEATSYSLKALLRLDSSSPLIPQAVNWLVRQRQGTRWFNTKDTAIACYALADYLRSTGELNPDLTIIVDVDGQEVRRAKVTKENLFTFDDEVKIVAGELGVGAKEISIRTEGKGNCYWSTYAEFFTKEESIQGAGSEVYVTRRYEKLTPKKVKKKRTIYDANARKNKEEEYEAIEFERSKLTEGEKLTSGDLIEVSLDIDARNNFEYVMFEDPKPAGCEPTELQSGYQWGGGLGTHTELRDEKVAFFASYLPQGKHTIAYRLRAEIPGEFHALPAFGECMYTPFVKGNSASSIIRIVDAP
jgi:uncharacterized protein YfaS (alpha-2-macroglobulin family)/tetratricopeptide (TPR) repeat protein